MAELRLTEDQVELASIVRALLQKRSDTRDAISSEAGYDDALWQALCEQVGVAALPVPEEHDGAGAGSGLGLNGEQIPVLGHPRVGNVVDPQIAAGGRHHVRLRDLDDEIRRTDVPRFVVRE